ncbi:MAG: YraN family protein [Pseudomonadota bacterium]
MNDRGAWAEDLAAGHLQAQGLELLTRNYRRKYGELDLVMRDGDVLVYVEVRYRASNRFGGSLASITAQKQRRLINAAQSYTSGRRSLRSRPARFDVVAITGPPSAPALRWIRNAFSAG